MQFFKTVSLFALASQSFATLTQIKLYAKSENQEIDGKGLYYTHEGAGINYFFVSTTDDGAEVTYDDESKTIYSQVNPQIRFQFSTEGDIVQLSVFTPEAVEIGSDGVLSFNGSDALQAAKNISDPYSYSQDSYAVVVGDKGGAPLQIVAKSA
ncbi:uncharacterized protein LODBEIA_P52870 [Lodderomyces beijingensis]|uniref:Uncharacterized protein n=1 Tax=Lodderomyces beijingensis TaxID=1775926 RepID=A0ABP0ZSF7_9ASCO